MNAELAAKNMGVSTENPAIQLPTVKQANSNLKQTLEHMSVLGYEWSKGNPQRLYHVGLNRGLEPLKRWYYGKRGWLRGIYYVRPEQSAWVEWLHCLVSPSHAKRTWLRLDPEVEATSLRATKLIVTALCLAVVFVGGMVAGEIRILHAVQRSQAVPVHVHLRTVEGFNG